MGDAWGSLWDLSESLSASLAKVTDKGEKKEKEKRRGRESYCFKMY